MLRNRFAKRGARLGIFYTGFQTSADDPCCAGCNRITSVIESGHRDLESLAFFADSIRRRNFHILKADPACQTGAHAQLPVNIASASLLSMRGQR